MTVNYRNFIYDEKRGFVFAYVPKVACTNWKSVFRYLAGFPDYLDNRLAHDKILGGLRYLDLTGTDLGLLSDPGIAKYTFVRNPYSRALSGFLNKIQSSLPLLHSASDNHWIKITRKVEEFRITTLDSTAYPIINFEIFLLWLHHGASHFRNDEHWQKQSVLLRWPTVRFNFIGRMESLEADAKYLLEEIGCDIAFPTQKDVNFAPTKATDKLEAYMTPACRSLIEQIFSDDFVNFGYAISNPLVMPEIDGQR